MTDNDPVTQQVKMTRATWQALLEHGVREWDDLEVDFSYQADSEDSAHRLVQLLREQPEYVAEAVMFEGSWWVSGTARIAGVTLAVLEQWVTRMVLMGEECGCTFDGWGMETPD